MDGYHLGYQLHGTHRLSAAVAAVGTAAVGTAAVRTAAVGTAADGAPPPRRVPVCRVQRRGRPETASEAGCVGATCVRARGEAVGRASSSVNLRS